MCCVLAGSAIPGSVCTFLLVAVKTKDKPKKERESDGDIRKCDESAGALVTEI